MSSLYDFEIKKHEKPQISLFSTVCFSQNFHSFSRENNFTDDNFREILRELNFEDSEYCATCENYISQNGSKYNPRKN